MSEVIKSLRELDALIAENIFGRDRWNARCDPVTTGSELQYHWGYPIGHDVAPDYSTDISAAWKVVEKMREEGYAPNVFFDRAWACSLRKMGHPNAKLIVEMCQIDWGISESDQPPVAICLAVLKAKGIEVEMEIGNGE